MLRFYLSFLCCHADMLTCACAFRTQADFAIYNQVIAAALNDNKPALALKWVVKCVDDGYAASHTLLDKVLMVRLCTRSTRVRCYLLLGLCWHSNARATRNQSHEQVKPARRHAHAHAPGRT